jgi:hypothetical protein
MYMKYVGVFSVLPSDSVHGIASFCLCSGCQNNLASGPRQFEGGMPADAAIRRSLVMQFGDEVQRARRLRLVIALLEQVSAWMNDRRANFGL